MVGMPQARDDGEPVEDLDVVDFDVASRLGSPNPGGRRWLLGVLLLALVAVGFIGSRVGGSASPPARPSASPSDRTQTSPPTGPTPVSPGALAGPPVTVSDLGHSLLGAPSGWELFGRSDGEVIRIQFALGRITRTRVPALASTGPVTFVVTATSAMIRPIDSVPGLLVPDGHPARQMPTDVSAGGPFFPGPDPTQVWQQLTGTDPPVLALVGPDGVATDRRIVFGKDTTPLNATPDGAGYLLVPGLGGVYDARPDGMHRVTGGQVLAAGPTGWLVSDCDAAHVCANSVQDRGGHTYAMPGPANLSIVPPGRISPDGKVAAVFTTPPDAQHGLALTDLTTGTTRTLGLALSADADQSALAWSPDSRWLFVVDTARHLRVIDPTTTDSVDPEWAPFTVTQIAIRASPGTPPRTAS